MKYKAANLVAQNLLKQILSLEKKKYRKPFPYPLTSEPPPPPINFHHNSPLDNIKSNKFAGMKCNSFYAFYNAFQNNFVLTFSGNLLA